MNRTRKRIIICEDHSIIRLGLGILIRDLYPDAFIQETDELEPTLLALDKSAVDLLVLDINIPGGDNFNMISLIRQKQSDIKILVFSGYDEHIYAIPYLNAGANGFVSKDVSHEEFKRAIISVIQGERYMSARVREIHTDLLLNKGLNPFERLSEREMEIMNLLSKGCSIKAISSQLHISSSTVSTYKARIFEKLGVDNVIDMSQKAALMNNKNG